MSEARRSGEKTKALPTSLPRPRVVKMGCPDGHRPLPPSSPNTAASAYSHPGRPLVISDDPISAARWLSADDDAADLASAAEVARHTARSSAAHLGHLGGTSAPPRLQLSARSRLGLG